MRKSLELLQKTEGCEDETAGWYFNISSDVWYTTRLIVDYLLEIEANSIEKFDFSGLEECKAGYQEISLNLKKLEKKKSSILYPLKRSKHDQDLCITKFWEIAMSIYADIEQLYTYVEVYESDI